MLSKVSELDKIPSARCSYLKRRSGTQSWAASAHGNEEVDSEEPKTIILVWCSKWAAHTKHKKESKIFRWNSIFLFPNYINTGIVIQMTYMLGWACEHVTMYSAVEWGQWGPGAGYQQILVDVSPWWHGVIIAHQGTQWILSPIDTASINTNIIFIVHTYSI